MTKIDKLSTYTEGCMLDTAFYQGYEQGRKDMLKDCFDISSQKKGMSKAIQLLVESLE